MPSPTETGVRADIMENLNMPGESSQPTILSVSADVRFKSVITSESEEEGARFESSSSRVIYIVSPGI